MSKEYDLRYKDKKVGFVKLIRCGMFYKLTCRFHLQEQGVFRLFAGSSEKKTDLGQCVRYGQALGAERCLPVKIIGEGELDFFVLAEGEDETFIPISGDRPFLQLDKLLNARFAIKSETKGILLLR